MSLISIRAPSLFKGKCTTSQTQRAFFNNTTNEGEALRERETRARLFARETASSSACATDFSHRNVDTRSAEKTSRFLPCHSDIRPLSAMMPRSLIIIRVARERGARNFIYTHLGPIDTCTRSHGKEREEEKKNGRGEEEGEDEEEGEEESARRAEGRGKEGDEGKGGWPGTVDSSRSSNSNGSAGR